MRTVLGQLRGGARGDAFPSGTLSVAEAVVSPLPCLLPLHGECW